VDKYLYQAKSSGRNRIVGFAKPEREATPCPGGVLSQLGGGYYYSMNGLIIVPIFVNIGLLI